MKRLYAGFILTALLLTHFQPFAWSVIPEVLLDKSDNLAPVLVSFNFDYTNAQAGSTLGITIVVRDDKNQTSGFIILELLAPTGAGTPQRQEGYYYFANPDKTLVSRIVGTGYIEDTWKVKIKVPTLVGQWSANRLVIYDSANNGMQLSMDRELCSNRSGNSLSDASKSFIDLPCQYSKALQVTTDPSREQLEAEAKIKSETDARTKVAADKAAIDNAASEARINAAKSKYSELSLEIDLLIKKYPSKKSEIELYKKKITLFERIDQANIPTVELNLAGIESKIVAMRSIYSKIARTITCTKEKKSLKVLDVNPKCPAGYKVKK
jgi:hypothetical protein